MRVECEVCGSHELVQDESGMFCCPACGARYTAKALRARMASDAANEAPGTLPNTVRPQDTGATARVEGAPRPPAEVVEPTSAPAPEAPDQGEGARPPRRPVPVGLIIALACVVAIVFAVVGVVRSLMSSDVRRQVEDATERVEAIDGLALDVSASWEVDASAEDKCYVYGTEGQYVYAAYLDASDPEETTCSELMGDFVEGLNSADQLAVDVATAEERLVGEALQWRMEATYEDESQRYGGLCDVTYSGHVVYSLFYFASDQTPAEARAEAAAFLDAADYTDATAPELPRDEGPGKQELVSHTFGALTFEVPDTFQATDETEMAFALTDGDGCAVLGNEVEGVLAEVADEDEAIAMFADAFEGGGEGVRVERDVVEARAVGDARVLVLAASAPERQALIGVVLSGSDLTYLMFMAENDEAEAAFESVGWPLMRGIEVKGARAPRYGGATVEVGTGSEIDRMLRGLGTFEEVTVTGKGSDVVEVPCAPMPCLIEVTHDGTSNFALTTHGKGGEYGELLVNVIGPYEGEVTTYLNADKAYTIEVDADGTWSLTFRPMSAMERVKGEGTTAQGDYHGDRVVCVDLEKVMSVGFSHNGSAAFTVRAEAPERNVLLIDEVGTYAETVLWSEPGTFFIVHADGDWLIIV